MIVVLKERPDADQLDSLIRWLENKDLQVFRSPGRSQMILGLVGDTTKIDADLIAALDIVESVRRIQEPFKKANRKFHPDDTVITLKNGLRIGGGTLTMIAGPSSVESEEQIFTTAKAVKEGGAQMLRGGTFKPRTSPYSFQGLHEEGVKLLVAAGKEAGLPTITEIMNIDELDCMQDIDVLQVGARNMQNFELLKELGKSGKPVLLKRGLSSTYEELLMSAEYIMSEGNEDVILCERGIRTFETYTRNTMDLAAAPVLKQLSHLPVILDPSHAGGRPELVEPLSCAAVAAGADGLIIEVHNEPQRALSDGSQQLRPEAYAKIDRKCRRIHAAVREED